MRATFALIASLLFTALAPADAHEGHSHDEPVRTLAPVAPRGEAQAGEFEVVALLGNGEVIVYLDRFATNEPVTNAEIEALTPAGSEKAVLNADGTLSAKPQVIKYAAGPQGAAVASAAQRAVLRCVTDAKPLKLPPNLYAAWKEIEINFDPSEMGG